MPWKNGLGVTSEIEIFPADASVAAGNFIWRLSSARIAAASPFSAFVGCDRLLTVTKGTGLRLNEKELRPGEIFRFKGEDAIDCKLLKDAVEDLGLIYQRAQVKAEMQIRQISETETVQAQSRVVFWSLLSGRSDIAGQDFSLGDILRLEQNERVEIRSHSGASRWIQVQINW